MLQGIATIVCQGGGGMNGSRTSGQVRGFHSESISKLQMCERIVVVAYNSAGDMTVRSVPLAPQFGDICTASKPGSIQVLPTISSESVFMMGEYDK
jgi:hypothetical protein